MANLIKLSKAVNMNGPKELHRLSLAGISRLVSYLRVRLGTTTFSIMILSLMKTTKFDEKKLKIDTLTF
jgi:hypothetical protein